MYKSVKEFHEAVDSQLAKYNKFPAVGDRVKRIRKDYNSEDPGTIVELDATRARVKWDDAAKRTWVRLSNLRVIGKNVT